MDSAEEEKLTDEGAVSRLIGLSTAGDLLLLCVVPVVLLAVATLPLSVRQSVIFEYDNPTLRTAVLSSFVHLGWRHLAVNLLGYVLVVPVAYLLSAVNGEHTRFRIVFISLVLVCPVLLSYLNLTIVRDAGSAGFSGVLMALYGYLPLAIASHAEEQFGFGRQRTTAPLLFFVGLTLITLLTLWAVQMYGATVPFRGRTVAVGHVLKATLSGLLVVLGLVLALYLLSVSEEGLDLLATVQTAMDRTGHFELTVVALGLFFALPFATFPIDPVVNGRVLNLYTHLMGYALGFIATYVLVAFEAATAGSS